MAIRCKVQVIQLTNQFSIHQAVEDGRPVPNTPICSVTLAAMPEPGSYRWAKYMPRVELTMDSHEANNAFKLGGTYFVDFTIATAEERPCRP